MVFTVDTATATSTLSLGSFTTSIGSPLEQDLTATVPAYTSSAFEIALPTGTSAVASVIIGTDYYTVAADPTNLQPGEYTYTLITLIISPYAALMAGTEIDYIALADSYPGGKIPADVVPPPYPDFFTQWNIEGSVSYTRNFKGHPSAAGMKFVTKASNEASVRAALKNGTQVNFHRVGLMVQSLNIVRLSTHKYPGNFIAVTVQFTGKWDSFGSTARSELDRPVKPKKVAAGSNSTTIAALCGSRSVSYLGPTVTIKVPKSTPSSAATTIRQELESRAIVASGFPYYSNPSAVEIRRFGATTMHFLVEGDIFSEEIPINLPGYGAVFQGIQLVEEFNNTLINLSTTGDTDGNELVTLVESDDEPENPPRYMDVGKGEPSSPTSLKNPSMAWDAGGPTKSKKTITYLNGSTLKEVEEKWGFVFAASQVYSVSYDGTKYNVSYNGATDDYLSSYWKKVLTATTTYKYDAAIGYLKEVARIGKQSGRYKQETANLETIELLKKLKSAQSGGSDPAKITSLSYQIAAYTNVIDLKINDITTYKLALLSDYYSDIRNPDPSDKDWIPPMFAIKQTRTDNSVSSAPDPASTSTDKKPDLITGKNFISEKVISIVYPDLSPGGRKKPEIYRESELTSNQEGPLLRNTLRIKHYREVKGRPGVHTRVDQKKLDKTEPKEPNSADTTKYKYVLISYGSYATPTDPEQGSVSFPDVSSPNIARQCAQTDLAIKNLSAESFSLRLRYNPSYDEGDLIVYKGFIYVILSISQSHRIERYQGQPRLQCESFEVKLGIYLNAPVSMYQVVKETTGTATAIASS